MGILEYSFFQNALLGCVLASILCGIVGTYIVTRRLVFISGGITHASFGGMFWTFGMSVGIICSFLTPGFMPDLPSYLFGSVLTIGRVDLCLLAVVTGIVVLLFSALWRVIIAISFDPVFARSRHLPVRLVEYVMMVIIAVTIVSTLRLVGVVLAISLLTVPQMTANIFTSRYLRMMLYSIFFGIIYSL